MNLLIFVSVASKYVYKDVPHTQKRYVGGLSLKPPRGPVPPWARAREVSDIPGRGQVRSYLLHCISFLPWHLCGHPNLLHVPECCAASLV